MGLVEMVMPKMGESVMEGTVLSWLKQVGDRIEEDEPVLEVATDKVDTEVPAVQAGVLKEILAQEGEVVQVGAPIARIEIEGDGQATSSPTPQAETPIPVAAPQADAPSIAASAAPLSAQDDRFYSPLVKNMAKEEGIAGGELSTIQGSGKDGRVTKKDMLAYIATRGSVPAPAPQAMPASKPTPTIAIASGDDEIIQMDRMRKMIAERMVASKQTSPHVTSFVEADVTNLVNWRNLHKGQFKKEEGSNLTFTPILIEAIAQAIRDFPMINISVDGDKIIKKKDINVGMAAALPSGNLIVPVIKNADRYNLRGLALQVNDLASRARNNKLKPDELSGGTYTVSNVGTFGNVMGTPIIMQPQVAIMAFGAIVKKPAVIETPEGDFIGIRHKMFLSHSYDHRVVDGSLGGMFVRKVADYLEGFDRERSI